MHVEMKAALLDYVNGRLTKNQFHSIPHLIMKL